MEREWPHIFSIILLLTLLNNTYTYSPRRLLDCEAIKLQVSATLLLCTVPATACGSKPLRLN
jgi:hypothetical protein